MNIKYLVFVTAPTSAAAYADNSTRDTAIGGGIGGAVGAAIGNEVGGRDGAIIGGAIDGATGTAIATDEKKHRSDNHRAIRHGSYDGNDHYEVEYEALYPIIAKRLAVGAAFSRDSRLQGAPTKRYLKLTRGEFQKQHEI
jgi:hypothetical protein